MSFDIKENLKTLPEKPGVYLHKDKYGEIIYVGKASSLKNRVRQYFQSARNMDRKTAALASHIVEFEYIVTQTEMEALILENTLIKRHMPKYNVMLRDDKTYPYIKITLAEKYPRVLKTRILKNDGSKYFGPYADVGSLNRTIDLLNDIFMLKRCSNDTFPEGARPCLNGHIGRCRQICTGGIGQEEYKENIDAVISFLKGRNKDLIHFLKEKMKTASEAMDFENAARYRDYIAAANTVIEKQRVELLSSGDMDIVLASEVSEGVSQVSVFFVRSGRLAGREIHQLDVAENDDKAEIISAFMKQYYINQTIIPKEILLEHHIPDEDIIKEFLSDALGGNVRIIVPERGEKKALLDLAVQDAGESTRLIADRAKSKMEKELALGRELFETIERKGPYDGKPMRLEAYDISNTGGADSVGAMVVFKGSVPDRREYRRFRIRGEDGSDDYGNMQEVLYRRFTRGLSGDKGFATMPDLILIDGGLGHVNAALQVLSALKLDLDVAGMVKDDKHRTRGLIHAGKEIDLKTMPELYHLIGNIQEEVHRFVIDYHRGLRKSKAVVSELDEINGIGPKRRNALLTKFGGIDGIKNATSEELLSVPGMTDSAAKSVIKHFAGLIDKQDNK